MSEKTKLKIEHRPIIDLIAYVRNARVHTDDQLDALIKSIKRFGFNNPVLIDKKNGIIAGHGRVLAAMRMGMEAVPVIVLDHLTEAQKRAFILADNRITEMSEWDINLLDSELFDLSQINEDLGLDDLFNQDQPNDKNKPEAVIREFAVNTVFDQFWISVRGPLQHQAEVLKVLAALRERIPHLAVDIGITEHDEI